MSRIENGKIEFMTSETSVQFYFVAGEIKRVSLTSIVRDDMGRTVDIITVEEKDALPGYFDEKFARFDRSEMNREVTEK